jgi:hypothetical protein
LKPEFVLVDLLVELPGAEVHYFFSGTAFMHLGGAGIEDGISLSVVFDTLLGGWGKFPALGGSKSDIVTVRVSSLQVSGFT